MAWSNVRRVNARAGAFGVRGARVIDRAEWVSKRVTSSVRMAPVNKRTRQPTQPSVYPAILNNFVTCGKIGKSGAHAALNAAVAHGVEFVGARAPLLACRVVVAVNLTPKSATSKRVNRASGDTQRQMSTICRAPISRVSA